MNLTSLGLQYSEVKFKQEGDLLYTQILILSYTSIR